MISPYSDYREILKNEYEERLAKNPSYSLRAFARDLDVAPSRIVEILNRTRGLSRIVASRIVKRLGLSANEAEIFFHLVDAEHSRSPVNRKRASEVLKRLKTNVVSTLTTDAFRTIADWYHYAILELTIVADFRADANWIAGRLGLPKTVVDTAIARLKRLELLKDEDGTFRASESDTFSTVDVPSESLKKHHEQILEKASEAIYLQSVDERSLTSMTFAIDRRDIPMAKEMIAKFVTELSLKLQQSEKKDAVYCGAIQFFRLDHNAAHVSIPAQETP